MAATAVDKEGMTRQRPKTGRSRKKGTMITNCSVLVLRLIFCLLLSVCAREERGKEGVIVVVVHM